MAVKSSWSPGDVLAAADLTDTFGAKATYAYGTAAPGSPSTGEIWMDTSAGTAVPVAKVYTGSAFVPFSGAAQAAATGGTESDLTNPDGDGKNYHLHTFTTNGTLTFTRAGWAQYLVVGGGTGGYSGATGNAGRVVVGSAYFAAGSAAVTVGTGANFSGSTGSQLSTITAGAMTSGPAAGTGAGALTTGGTAGVTSSITGTAVIYGRATGTVANPGDGGPNGGTGGNGIVLVRYQV